jgi:ATPase subunit of ABC transporter with duplicated ATPase domains
MGRVLLTLAFGLLASAAQTETITVPTWGCRDLETVERMNEAILAGERRAAEAIIEGDDCVWWAPGTWIELIDRHPEGLEGSVGERGRALSGGERQRISIARALLKDPPILILDEATSALDAATEAKLLRALEEVIRGRTTFVIAHRLATIRRANRILVFDRGQIVETGSFDELVARGGRFAALLELEAAGWDWRSQIAG